MAYCNSTTDLQREFSRIEDYQAREVIKNWTHLGSDRYAKDGTGYVSMVIEDNSVVYDEIEFSAVDAGEFYYDAELNRLYIKTDGEDDPDDHTIEVGEDWDTLKTDAINEASALIDARLNRAFPTPILPRSSREYTTDTYDPDLVRACAALACALIIRRVDPNDINGKMLYKYAINPTPIEDEELGIIDQYLNGTLVFQDQITAREVGNWNILATSDNTGTYAPQLFGKYTGSMYKQWKIEVDTGGSLGTGTFKVSYDGTGDTWDLTTQDMIDAGNDEYRMYIADGIYIYWPNTTWTLGDSWTVKLYPLSDTATVKTFGSIEGTRL